MQKEPELPVIDIMMMKYHLKDKLWQKKRDIPKILQIHRIKNRIY
nr:hypothetical protein [Helicobacter pullorum]